MAMISKEYLLKAFDVFNDEKHAPEGWMSAMKTAKEIVEEAPSIDVKSGRWLLYSFTSPIGVKCSVCRRISYFVESEKIPDLCPNCGAYMGGDLDA